MFAAGIPRPLLQRGRCPGVAWLHRRGCCLQVPQEKVLINIDRVGNTSSASIPILLDESLRSGKVRRGDTVLMSALGAGISWGSAIVRI